MQMLRKLLLPSTLGFIFCMTVMESLIQAGSPDLAMQARSECKSDGTLTGPSPPATTKERIKLARRLWQESKYSEASHQLDDLWRSCRARNSKEYDSEFAEVARDLGSVYEDMGAFATARQCYEALLQYDLSRLKLTDPRIGVEYNNIGMCHYLQGQISQREEDRAREFNSALQNFRMAEASWQRNRKYTQQLALNMRNQFITLCELGDDAQTNLAKTKMLNLEQQRKDQLLGHTI